MFLRQCAVVLCLKAALLFVPGHASEPISIVLSNSPEWADSNTTGFAPEFMLSVKDEDLPNFRLLVVPLKRAFVIFPDDTNYVHCYLGGDPKTIEHYTGVKTIASKVIVSDKMHVYTLKKNPTVQSAAELENSTVSIPTGFEDILADLKLTSVSVISVKDSSIGMKLLEAGRVDAHIGMLNALPQNKLPEIHWSNELVFLDHGAHLNCKEDDAAQAFLNHFDEAFTAKLNAGQLDAVYDRYRWSKPE